MYPAGIRPSHSPSSFVLRPSSFVLRPSSSRSVSDSNTRLFRQLGASTAVQITGKQRCCCSTQLRSCVGRTVGLGTVVIAAVFILVGESEIRLGERKYPQRCRVRCHCDLAVQSAQHFGATAE